MIDLQQMTNPVPKAAPMPRDPNWITVAAVAELLQVSPATVWRLQKAGKLAGIRTYQPSATLYYWKPDVEGYVRRSTHGEAPGTAPAGQGDEKSDERE